MRQIYIGKTHIQVRLEFVFSQRTNLIGDQGAGTHSLFRHPQNSVRLQRIEECLVHLKQYLLLGCDGILRFRPRRHICAGDQVVGAPKVGDELADRDATGGALVDDRVI